MCVSRLESPMLIALRPLRFLEAFVESLVPAVETRHLFSSSKQR